jgi:hypothetical protein
MILRNFLFLDIATMTDYLSTLEGSIVEGPIDQTEVEKREKGGKAGYKIIEGSAASEASTETKQKLAVTDAARFQRLYELLEQQNLIQFLDAFDTDIWSQLRRGELLEIQATIRLPESFMLTQAVEDFAPLLDIMAAFDEDPLSDPKTRNAFEGIRAVAKLTEKKHIPLLFEAASTTGFRFVANLPRQYLRCELSDLQGEAIVFGKIQRILPKRKKLEVFSLLPAFTASLPGLNREQRHRMQREMSKQKLAEVVRGPAIVLAPVAVYR